MLISNSIYIHICSNPICIMEERKKDCYSDELWVRCRLLWGLKIGKIVIFCPRLNFNHFLRLFSVLVRTLSFCAEKYYYRLYWKKKKKKKKKTYRRRQKKRKNCPNRREREQIFFGFHSYAESVTSRSTSVSPGHSVSIRNQANFEPSRPCNIIYTCLTGTASSYTLIHNIFTMIYSVDIHRYLRTRPFRNVRRSCLFLCLLFVVTSCQSSARMGVVVGPKKTLFFLLLFLQTAWLPYYPSFIFR